VNRGARPALSLVIPAYNEALRIQSTLEKIAQHAQSWPYQWELIVIDDGSIDRTAAVARLAPLPVVVGAALAFRRQGRRGGVTARPAVVGTVVGVLGGPDVVDGNWPLVVANVLAASAANDWMQSGFRWLCNRAA